MVDSGIAIPAISHENFVPAMGSQFPETADTFWSLSASLRGVDGTRMSKHCTTERRGLLNAEMILRPVVN